MRATLARTRVEMAKQDKLGQTFIGTVGSMFKKFGGWSMVTGSMYHVTNTIRSMIQNVRDLDTAMTELRKVTSETEATYSKFFDTSIDRAHDLGATVSDTISATADFARLGYGIDDASILADAALVYKNVGDGIDSIDTASQSIISTMQGFGVAANDAMLVVDKFNEVGNNFSISSVGIGDALVRSAAALSAANNTLDESIALVTATNKVVQDPEKVGTTLKTVSMYLRAAKTEAAEAGIETDGMADSMSKLRGEILALTGNQVDIQIDEDTFKSTYQIMKEIAGVWDQISDVSQANILEKLGGKRNANVVAALIQNFGEAEQVLETAANASGSALAENEKYLDSIEGKITKFRGSFEAMSSEILDTGFVKGVVEGGTAALDVVTAIVDKLGALPSLIGLLTGVFTSYQVMAHGSNQFFNLDMLDDGSMKMTLFNRELSEIKASFLEARANSEGFFSSLYKGVKDPFTQYSSGIEYFNDALKSGTVDMDNYIDTLDDADGALNKYLKSLGPGQVATMSGFKNYCKQNSVALKEMTLSARAAGIAVKGLGVALNVAASVGIGLLIAGLTTLVVKLATAGETLRENTLDASSEYKDTASSISSYKAEVESLNKSLASNTLSEEEAYEARSRLLEIQDSLQSSYGAEADGLNLIAMSAEEAASAMDKLAVAEAKAFLYENANGILQAKRNMKESTRSVGMTAADVDARTYSKLEKIAGQTGVQLKDNGGQISVSVTADVKDAHAAFQEFKSEAEAQGINLGEIRSGSGTLESALNNQISTLSDIEAEYGETYAQYINASITANEQYSSALQVLTDAQENYNNAVNDSYNSEEERAKAIEDAIAGIDKAKVAMDGLAFSEKDAPIKDFFDDFWGDIDEASAGDRLKLQLDGIGEGNADAYILKIKDAIEDLGVAGKDGKVEIAEILSLMQDIDAAGGEGFETQSKALDVLSAAAEEAGVSFDHFLNILSETGYIKGYIGDALSALTNNLYTVESGFNSASTAIENYKAALEGGEKSDNFTAYAEAYDSFQAEVKAGTTNSNTFWAGAELLLGEDKIRELEYNSKAIIAAVNSVSKVWSSEGDFGVGFLNYIDGLDNAGTLVDEFGNKLIDIQKNSNGTWDFNFEPENLEKLLPLLNMTEEGFYACLEAVDMWANLNPANMEQVTERIESLGLAVETANEKIVSSESLEEQLASVYGKENAFQIMSELEEMGYKFVTTNDSAEELLKTATELGAVEVLKGFDENGKAIETTRVHVDEFVESLSKMGMSQESIE